MDLINDIKAVANYLKFKCNDILLYALGYSMGGFYVANVLREEPDIFYKAILLNPVVDTPPLFYNKQLMDGLWAHANNILLLEKPEVYKDEIRRASERYNPIGFAFRLSTPIAIVQSTADEVVAPASAKKFYDLSTCKKMYLEVPNATHDLRGDEKQLLEAIIG